MRVTTLSIFGLAVLSLAACRARRDTTAPGTELSETRIATLELTSDSPLDFELQAALEDADSETRSALGIPPQARAFGLLTARDCRVAWLRPDALFYGASVPKICILLAWFEAHPEAADALDPEIGRELGLMIKRSSNELAAKYSQLVGLDAIQALQLSERYRLYDPEHGGGLWSGKHYGVDEPRRGDPLENFSHTATVRQCLRYYLLLERGELVSLAASARMREVFAAPALDFHPTSFVDGLRFTGATVIRKSGLWEDWHLDTARVERDGQVYWLSGMAHHPRGREYLSRMARALDAAICGPAELPERSRNELVLHESEDLTGLEVTALPGGATAYTSPEIAPSRPFNELLPSWNLDAPRGSGFRIELQVARHTHSDWSPWLHVGDWGPVPDSSRTVEWEGGKIAVDYYRSDKLHRRARYRVIVEDATQASSGGDRIPVRRFALCFSDTTGLPLSTVEPAAEPPPLDPSSWQRRLAVPFRSQKVEDPAIAGSICSPTSVAMVLDYRGASRPTALVAERAFDPRHEIYGIWPRAVQCAWSFGVPGYVTRFARWAEVERAIARDQPLVISIRTRAGELTGAPHAYPSGHLLVVTGFDASGDVYVNDPAARTEAQGRTTYLRAELQRAWLDRGGTAYVLQAVE